MSMEKVHAVIDPFIHEELSKETLFEDLAKELRSQAEIVDEEKNLRDEVLKLERIMNASLNLFKAEAAVDKPDFLRVRDQEEYLRTKAENEKRLLVLHRALENLGSVAPGCSAQEWSVLSRRFARWRRLSSLEKSALLLMIMPVFKVTGLPGPKRGDAVVSLTSKTLNMAFTDENGNSSTNTREI
jgi:hypothetical protein